MADANHPDGEPRMVIVVGRAGVIRYLHAHGLSASECAAALGITTADALAVLEEETAP